MRVLNNNINIPLKGDYSALSVSDKEALYNQLNSFIGLLDDVCLKQILDNSLTDIDKIFSIFLEETHNILNLRRFKDSDVSLLNQLPAVKRGYEEYLRKANLNYFVHSVLPNFEMNWHNIEWFNMVQLYQRLCIMAARDHSKSYSFSFAYVLWRLYRYTRATALIQTPDDIKFYKEGMLITNEFKLAKKLLKKVKEEIQLNDVLRDALYPDKNTGGWANESLTCKNGAEIGLSSYRTSNRGPHPGWIVVDDFLDKSALYSKEQREKFIEIFHGEIMNMLLPQGQCLTIGTPFHEKDLYANLKTAPGWRVFEYPAIFPDGSLLWQRRYNFDALKQKRLTFGSMIFSREILVRPVSDTTSIFPWDILQTSFIGMNQYVLVENSSSFPVRFKKIATGVDLAISAKTGADYTVMITVGEDEIGRIWLLNMVRLHGASYNEQIANLQLINHSFRPDVILMEDNGFQRVMAGLAREAGMDNIVEHTTTGNTKKDLYEGLPSLAVLFERGQIKFPRGNEKSIESTNIICSELNSITFSDRGKLESVSEHDDTGISLYLAIKGLRYIHTGLFMSMI